VKQAETSREDSHLGIGGLADGDLAGGRGIQRDTLSRWRSRVQIPPGSSLHYFIDIGLYPVILPYPIGTRHKIPSHLWGEIIRSRGSRSLRNLAREYNVSHEAVRRAIKATDIYL